MWYTSNFSTIGWNQNADRFVILHSQHTHRHTIIFVDFIVDFCYLIHWAYYSSKWGFCLDFFLAHWFKLCSSYFWSQAKDTPRPFVALFGLQFFLKVTNFLHAYKDKKHTRSAVIVLLLHNFILARCVRSVEKSATWQIFHSLLGWVVLELEFACRAFKRNSHALLPRTSQRSHVSDNNIFYDKER